MSNIISCGGLMGWFVKVGRSSSQMMRFGFEMSESSDQTIHRPQSTEQVWIWINEN